MFNKDLRTAKRVCGERGGTMGKRFERYNQNQFILWNDLGPGFVGTADGKGGLIIPDAAIKRLKNGQISVDGIAYPFIVYEGQKYPIVKTSQGWTIGGEVVEKQH